MPTPYQLPLTPEQEAELAHARDHARQPYLRERAAVLLKIAAGLSIRSAARAGGLKPHHRDTVCDWVARYQTEGLAGLLVRPFPVQARAGARRDPRQPGKAARSVRLAAYALVARRGAPSHPPFCGSAAWQRSGGRCAAGSWLTSGEDGTSTRRTGSMRPRCSGSRRSPGTAAKRLSGSCGSMRTN
jgi:hypothetical protein